MKSLFLSLILTLSVSICHATDLKKINDNNLSDSVEAALNINFEKLNNELNNCVKLNSTQTINGYKSFANSITEIKIGTFTATAGEASSAVTGVGFRPKAVILSIGSGAVENIGSFAIGWALSSASNAQALLTSFSINGGESYITPPAGAYVLVETDKDGNIGRKATLSSMDSDGFTLAWSATSGNRVITYLAIK